MKSEKTIVVKLSPKEFEQVTTAIFEYTEVMNCSGTGTLDNDQKQLRRLLTKLYKLQEQSEKTKKQKPR